MLPRRTFLRAAGGLAGGLALGPLLAACGSSSEDEPNGIVHMANWPYYVDKALGEDGRAVYPSLQRFTRETGIQMDYREVVADAEWFFQEIQPYLAAGRPTGWDVMVITNGLTLTKLIRLGYLQEIPAAERPNFEDNAVAAVVDPAYDPGNRYTMAWQSGITGIAYNPELTGRRVTSLGDLFTDEFAGRVGMFRDAVDMPNLAMVAAGIDPETSTPEDWDRAAALLASQRQAGIVGRYRAQNYLHGLTSGEIAIAMAWSGDIFQANAEGQNQLEFVVPDEGGLLWTDAMCIPAHAANPVDALRFMDHVYRPDVAAQIAASVAYITPVQGARERLLGMAAASDDEAEVQQLHAVASSPLVFPDEEDLARLSTYRELENDEELARWNMAFGGFFR